MYTPINGYTKQSIIDKINNEIKGRSMREKQSEMCAYRGKDGMKCAVGIFIPDGAYCNDMDAQGANTSLNFLLKDYPHIQKFMPLEEDALNTLQRIHDTLSYPEDTIKPRLIKWVEDNVV